MVMCNISHFRYHKNLTIILSINATYSHFADKTSKLIFGLQYLSNWDNLYKNIL